MGGQPEGGGPAPPARLTLGIELVGLADVMAEGASGQQVPVDGELGKLPLEGVAQGQGQSGSRPGCGRSGCHPLRVGVSGLPEGRISSMDWKELWPRQ